MTSLLDMVKEADLRLNFTEVLRMRIPANVNGHSGERDRVAHRSGAGVCFLG